MALDAMNRALARDEVRELIEARLKFQRDEATRLEAALIQGREEGIEVGREEGLKTGREEGLKTGREEGLKSGREEGADLARLALGRKMPRP
ncbi:MAG: hypothetical protein AB1758_18820 [Candidatus Eremiobacterota bacterium]